MAQPLIINEWKNAIADSPHEGIGLVRNADIDTFPGALKSGKKPSTIFFPAASGTFTADASTDICTSTAMTTTANTTGNVVQLTTTGTLPAGLTTGTNYFVIRVDQGAGTFKLATTIANANAATAINITDAGSGTHTVTTLAVGTIRRIVKDTRNGIYYMHDSNGRVWYLNGTTANLLNGNTLTNGEGNGLALLRTSDGSATYLFVFRNKIVDVVNVFGTSEQENPSWTNGWKTDMNSGAGSGNSHNAINAQDNIIYFPDDRYVGSIKENSGQVFAPGNAATYTWNPSALDLPQGEVAYWIEELGVNLLISGASFNKIYPWDRISNSFSLPLPVPERGVYRMKNIGNIVYIQAGSRGNIYLTQGSYVRLFKKIPDYVINNDASVSGGVTWGGIESRNNELIVGLAATTTANSGVYLIYSDGRLTLHSQPSTGAANVTALAADGAEDFIMGYAGGADLSDGAGTRYTSFETVVQSELYSVATRTEKTSYHTLEAEFARTIASSPFGNCRVSYRTNLTASFTTIETYTFSGSDVTVYSFTTPELGIIDIENIQVQVEMDGTPELIELRFIP